MSTVLIRSPIGTPAWISEVRHSPPTRAVLSRRRATHQFAPYLNSIGRRAACEGANELTCALLLDILARAGLVRWFKDQPFTLTEAEHGIKATPDFLFEWVDGRRFVLETKSAKYVTEAVMAKATRLEALFDRAGLTYLFWTDDKQVAKPLRSNVRKLWHARGMQLDESDLLRTTDSVKHGPVPMGVLLSEGIHPQAIRQAIDQGRVHCNLTENLDERAILYPTVLERAYDVLLGGRPDPESWWNALPNRQAA